MSAARLELTDALIEAYRSLKKWRPTFDVKSLMTATYGHADARLLTIQELADLLRKLLRELKEFA